MSTKKTVDTEIVEEVEKIEPEVIEEVKEPVADDVKEPVADDVKEIVPVVKSPLRGISTPSMIHTHLDNFLAKLCGETPIDDNVRNSLEYWINELAEGHGGSTKPLYLHTYRLVRGTLGGAFTYFDAIVSFILQNDTALTKEDIYGMLVKPGAYIPVISGIIVPVAGADALQCSSLVYGTNIAYDIQYFSKTGSYDKTIGLVVTDEVPFTITRLSVQRLN